MNRFGFLLVYLLILNELTAQNLSIYDKNLVPNGSFENYKKKSGSIKQAIPWTEKGSVDFYQTPLTNDTTLQKGALTGNCYAGIRFQKRYKEFMQVRLAEALRRGTVYEFEMKVRLAFWSNALLRSFGVVFTKAGYRGQGDAIKSFMIDSICKKGGLNNEHKWFTIKGSYKAEGGEKYITIGNFAPKVKKDMLRKSLIGVRFKEAYYFVDDISLKRKKEPEEKVAIEIVGPNLRNFEEDSVLKVNQNAKVGDKIVLNNIFFDNGKYYLLPESNQELNKLAQYLLRHPTMEISINGHSDNGGMKWKNQKLSEQRAREVFIYLIKKGVQNKMYFKGFGSSQPIADNATDEGKAKNRRVEFEIVKE
jgi:OmpA-OmpF porin, OOP family